MRQEAHQSWFCVPCPCPTGATIFVGSTMAPTAPFPSGPALVSFTLEVLLFVLTPFNDLFIDGIISHPIWWSPQTAALPAAVCSQAQSAGCSSPFSLNRKCCRRARAWSWSAERRPILQRSTSGTTTRCPWNSTELVCSRWGHPKLWQRF